MTTLLDQLRGGDRRSLGETEVVRDFVRDHPERFDEIYQGLFDADVIVRARSAHVVSALGQEFPTWMEPYRSDLLRRVAITEQWEVRQQVCLLLPVIATDRRSRKEALKIASEYIRDQRAFVVAFAMQALVDLTTDDAQLRKEILPTILDLTETGSAAIRARGRRLLKQIGI